MYRTGVGPINRTASHYDVIQMLTNQTIDVSGVKVWNSADPLTGRGVLHLCDGCACGKVQFSASIFVNDHPACVQVGRSVDLV